MTSRNLCDVSDLSSLAVGDFVQVRLVYKAPQSKTVNKYFYARILTIEGGDINCQFLRQSGSSNVYMYPNVDDFKIVQVSDIVRRIDASNVTQRRGRYNFP